MSTKVDFLFLSFLLALLRIKIASLNTFNFLNSDCYFEINLSLSRWLFKWLSRALPSNSREMGLSLSSTVLSVRLFVLFSKECSFVWSFRVTKALSGAMCWLCFVIMAIPYLMFEGSPLVH